jgi:predicted acylesterase/phospholipase RssA
VGPKAFDYQGHVEIFDVRGRPLPPSGVCAMSQRHHPERHKLVSGTTRGSQGETDMSLESTIRLPARGLALMTVACVLAGCGAPRPEALQGEVCKSMATAGRTPYPWPDIYQSTLDAQMSPAPSASAPEPAYTPRAAAVRLKLASQAAVRQEEQRQVAPQRAAPPPPPTRILSVSAGGAWGAFSAGFLEGWGENAAEPRPSFDVVTGVSTGSMIAPVIFLGDAKRMAKLREMYSGLSDKDAFTKRSLLSLATATSLYDNAPLRRKVEEMMDEEMVEAIAGQSERRTLLVLAANLDSGVPDVFDLTGIAARKDMAMVDKRRRIIAAIMASAALPLAFPPEFIDNNLYVDGGVRLHVFFTREVLAALPGRQLDVTIVVSGDLKVERDCTGKNGLDLLSIAGRTATIAIDQLLRSSVESMLTVGRQRGNVARYIDAADLIDYGATVLPPGAPRPGPCRIGSDRTSDDQFDPAFQSCLAKHGYEMGKANPIPWRLTIRGGRVGRGPMGSGT